MKVNKFKKILISCASATLLAVGATFSACSLETKHPRAKIEVSFNNKVYSLEYTLYRNMYPNTVQHFIELADNGFYNNMIVHDYKTNDWFTGGYAYTAEYGDYTGGGSQMAQYLDANSKESKYYSLFDDGKLTPSVYSNVGYKTDKDGNIVYDEGNNYQGTQIVDKKLALPTLIGEFTNNINQVIKNGALTDSYGCLKMFYYEKECSSKIYVTPTEDQIIQADYKSNCATSLFTIQVTSSSGYKASDYCIFASLRNREELEALVDAVDEMFDDLDDETVEAAVRVDAMEPFSKEEADKDMEKTFSVPTVPLVIKSVKITKY